MLSVQVGTIHVQRGASVLVVYLIAVDADMNMGLCRRGAAGVCLCRAERLGNHMWRKCIVLNPGRVWSRTRLEQVCEDTHTSQPPGFAAEW